MSGVVVGIDGSAHSEVVLEWAMREAALRNAPLTVLAVQGVLASQWTGQVLPVAGDEDELKRLRQTVEEAVHSVSIRLADERPVSVSLRVEMGFPAPVLIGASKDADLIVVGSRGAGGFSRLMLGSVSSQVLHHAECPVVVIPHKR